MAATGGGRGDAAFQGSIPELYDTLLVPLIFEPMAGELARRVAALAPARVLETAAGTGVATRALAQVLPPRCEIVATDLNAPMLARAQAVGTARPVRWQTADAMALPFDAQSFDVVVCQFGVMFFPDKPAAFAEARRVLEPGGAFVFNTWDDLAHNEVTDIATRALAALYPDDPPRFMARTPHGYADVPAIARDLAAGGFAGGAVHIETVGARSRAPTAQAAATAICQGTPLRHEIEARARPGAGLAEATAAAARALEAHYGGGPVDGPIRAHFVVARA